MPRKYARTKLSINDDPDFENLSTEAQWLYQRVMLTHDSLSACGVMDWRPKRLLRKSRTITLKKLIAAAAELERARFALFDLEFEEALVRTYVRHDEPLRNPKMAAPVVVAYQGVTSPELRAAVVTEIQREYSEHPDYSPWEHKDTAADLARIMSRPNASQVGYTYAYSDFFTDPDGERITDRIGYPDSIENGDPDSVRIPDPTSMPISEPDPDVDTRSDSVRNLPTPSPTNVTSHLPGGYVTRERHQGGATDSIDSLQIGCDKHPNNDGGPCHACQAKREEREAFGAKAARLQAEQRATERRKAAEIRAAAIDSCPLGCVGADTPGYWPDGRGGFVLCTHEPPNPNRPTLRAQFEALERSKIVADPESASPPVRSPVTLTAVPNEPLDSTAGDGRRPDVA